MFGVTHSVCYLSAAQFAAGALTGSQVLQREHEPLSARFVPGRCSGPHACCR
jgi:hypothetical protein